MLSKILSKSYCADCKFCCTFTRPSRWEMPVGVEFDDSGAAEQPCIHLDMQKGCVLGDDKPEECKMWPLRVMQLHGKQYITVSMRCHAYSELFYQNVLQLLRDGLREQIAQIVLRRPEIVRDYRDSYRLVCPLKGEDDRLCFSRATIDDTAEIFAAACNANREICQYSAGFLTALADKYDARCCFTQQGMFVYMKKRSVGDYAAYLVPAGDLAVAMPKLCEHAAYLGKKPMLWGALPEDIARLKLLGYRFSVTPERDWFDYIYSTAALAALSGSEYQKKHTACRKFMRDYNGRFEYHVIDSSNVRQVAKYQKSWLDARTAQVGYNAELAGENEQISFILRNFERLGARGGMVTVDGRIGGYTLSVPINEKMLDVTTLKSSREFANITVYLINRFCDMVKYEVEFVNFEEDIGIEGLRKFKQDFKPVRLLEKSRIFIETE